MEAGVQLEDYTGQEQDLFEAFGCQAGHWIGTFRNHDGTESAKG